MKKLITLVAVLLVLLCASVALADDMGVQLIGGPGIETEPTSLDDVALDTEYTIDGYAILTAKSFSFEESFYEYEKGYAGDNSTNFFGFLHWVQQASGANAKYAYLVFEITNTSHVTKRYLQNAEIKVVYDDEYVYSGWVRQYNLDHAASWGDRVKDYSPAIIPEDEEPTGIMYSTRLIFGCTLPNAVVESKKPLRMEINLDGNEITYNIRK